MKRKINYYVTMYQGIAFYEPAEGGYYYEGRQGICSYTCKSLKKARRILRHIAEDGGFKMPTANRCVKRGAYIGNTEEWLIETKQYSHDVGRREYE